MRRGLFFLLLTLPFVAGGCDSNEGDKALVGTWRLRLLEDAQGDQTVTFDKAAQSLFVTFDRKENFTYTLDFVRTSDIVLRGAYKTSGTSITFEPSGQEAIRGSYIADGTGALLLEFGEDVSERLLGPGYTGTVRMSFTVE